MKIRLRVMKDDRKWVDKKFTLKDLMVILVLAKDQNYSIKKYLDGYEIFAGTERAGSIDSLGNLAVDDKLYFQYKQKSKTQKDKMNEITARFNSDTDVEHDFPVTVVREYLNVRNARNAAAEAFASRNKAIAGSAAIFRKRAGDRIRLANGDVKTPEDFAEYLYNIYKQNRVFDKWYEIITTWYLDGTLKEDQQTFIRSFIEAVNMLAEAHYDEYDLKFNGLMPNEIVARFSKNAKKAASRERTISSLITPRETDYEVVPITSQQEARKYARYVDWCITQNSYGSYCGLNDPSKAELFYFVLKKGYENVERKKGPNAPKDEYGLSMIAVSVKTNGDLHTSTTRWNHSNGGTDNSFTPVELGELVGGDFFSIFLPITTEDELVKLIAESSQVVISAADNKNKVVLYSGDNYLINDGKVVKDLYGYNLSFALVSLKNGRILGRSPEDWIIIDENLELVFEGDRSDARKYWSELNS